jgi:hypothetical protein
VSDRQFIALAAPWHAASGIAESGGAAGAARLTWWADDAPMRANHRTLCEVYRRAGCGRADFSLLQTFHTGYQLMRTAAGPRVLLAVAHQEDIAEMKPHAAH